jgi:hypothetical protein
VYAVSTPGSGKNWPLGRFMALNEVGLTVN